MSDASLEARLELLADEKNRLDAMLDEALDRFAEYEEGFNPRMKLASPDELPLLMAERTQMEETLGIAHCVDRLDELRIAIEAIKREMA
jgi:hypothetical protein